MKSKKVTRTFAIAVVVLSLLIGAVYFDKHYAIIDKKSIKMTLNI